MYILLNFYNIFPVQW